MRSAMLRRLLQRDTRSHGTCKRMSGRLHTRIQRGMAAQKEILSLSLPIVATVLAQNLYSVADSVFLSYLGEEALSALSLASIVQNIFQVIMIGIATGVHVCVSEAMGRGDALLQKASVWCGALLETGTAIVIAGMALFLPQAYFLTSTQNETVAAAGIAYLLPAMALSLITAAQILLQRVLQAKQRTKYAMFSQLIGLGVNLLLDPVLIFGLFGFPEWNMSGAVAATLIGQVCAAIAATIFLLRADPSLITRGPNRQMIRGKLLYKILSIGIPASMVSVFASIGNYVIQRLLITYQDNTNAVFGVYNRVETFILLPRQAVSAGVLTLLSFYLGQKNVQKMKDVLLQAQILVVLWSGLCSAVCIFFAGHIMTFFHLSGETYRMGFACFGIIALTYIPSGIAHVMNSFFQSTGKSYYATLFVLIRHVTRIVIAVILFQKGNIDLSWWSWPISELASDSVLTLLFLRSVNRPESWMKDDMGGSSATTD